MLHFVFDCKLTIEITHFENSVKAINDLSHSVHVGWADRDSEEAAVSVLLVAGHYTCSNTTGHQVTVASRGDYTL